MSKSRILRIFFAIDLSREATASVSHIINQLQASYKHQHLIRWIKPQNLHITLQFLGTVKEEDLLKLINNVRTEIVNFPAFDLELLELELFPTQYQPHIISLNMDQKETLADLAKSIGNGIVKTGYEVEKRPFRGHLTLARLNRVEKNFSLAEIQFPKIEKIPVREIVFYKSEPNKEGSNYTVIERIKIKNSIE